MLFSGTRVKDVSGSSGAVAVGGGGGNGCFSFGSQLSILIIIRFSTVYMHSLFTWPLYGTSKAMLFVIYCSFNVFLPQ